MNEAEARKARSIAILQEYGVPYIEHLPVIEDSSTVKVPDIEMIARRAVCILITIQHACDLMNDDDINQSRDFCLQFLERWGIVADLTPNERHIYSGEASRQEIINMVWKYEAYWVLIWALGFVAELDVPTTTCDCDFAIQAVNQFRSLNEFLEQASLRSITEILDQADLIYRYDWACVDARIKNDVVAGGLNSGVVFERHWAFNWLIGYGEDWDNVSTDT